MYVCMYIYIYIYTYVYTRPQTPPAAPLAPPSDLKVETPRLTQSRTNFLFLALFSFFLRCSRFSLLFSFFLGRDASAHPIKDNTSFVVLVLAARATHEARGFIYIYIYRPRVANVYI